MCFQMLPKFSMVGHMLYIICLSVMLVDCDRAVQQKVEMTAHDGIGWCLAHSHAEADQDHNILWSRILQLGIKNVEFWTLLAIISSVSCNGSYVALSQHLLSKLLVKILPMSVLWNWQSQVCAVQKEIDEFDCKLDRAAKMVDCHWF